MIKMNKIKLISGIFGLIFLFSCATTTRTLEAGRNFVLNEKLKNNKKAAVIRFKKHRRRGSYFELTSPFLPGTRIIGRFDILSDAEIELNFTQVTFLANWPNGWTEGSYEASGQYRLTRSPAGWQCEKKESFEKWDLVKGEIRYFDQYFRKEEGKKKVNNRMNRIEQVVDFLKTTDQFPLFFGHPYLKTSYGNSFIYQVKPFLFPELAGFERLKNENLLPAVYYEEQKAPLTETDLDEDSRSEASDIETTASKTKKYQLGAQLIWRLDYTQKVFPAHLHRLRDSGTLWRDYEEAVGLFHCFYNLDHFLDTIMVENQWLE